MSNITKTKIKAAMNYMSGLAALVVVAYAITDMILDLVYGKK